MLKRTIQALLLLLVLLVSPVASGQDPSIYVQAPTEAKGDGATPIQIRVDLNSTRAGELEALQVEASAGRIVGRREPSPGSVELTLVPPRVVEDVVLTVTLRARGGQRAKSVIKLSPAIAKAETRASKGSLGLQVPARMILGYDKEATITFRANTRSAVTLYASAGSISAPKRETADRFRAVYNAPAEKLPRVALIVAATADGSIVDYAPIQLYGYPLVSTLSEPRATVLTRVAGEVYGPFQADQRGRVELRVLVPPGITEAQTVAQDALHNERTVTLKLGVSAVHEAFAICPSASETLFYFAVDAEGAPRKNIDILLSSSLGSLSPPKLSDGGYYASPLALPVEVTLGETIRLTAQIAHEAESRVVCDTTVAGEAPIRLQLSTASDTWVAGSGRSLRVDIHASYLGKRTPRAVTMLGSADLGEVSPVEAQSAEHAVATWYLPANLGGRREAKLQVQTVGPRPVKGELVIHLRPGAPATAKIVAQPDQLKSDGHSESQVVVEVRDTNGNLVDAVPEVIEAKGTVSRFTNRSTGVYAATYRAPRWSSLAHDDVRVRVANTRTTETVRINIIPTSNRARIWGKLGYATNFAKVQGPVAYAGGGIRLPVLGEHLIAGAEVGYLAARDSELDAAGQEQVSMKITVVPITARAVYELTLSDFSPYLGVAGGVGMVRFDVSSPSSGRLTQWKTRPALSGMAGALWRLGPGSLLAEVMYSSITLSEAAVSGTVGGLSSTAGYLYEF